MIFRPFPRFVGPMSRATALRHCKGRVDKALFFVQHPTRAKFVGDVSQDSAQNLALTPSLKPAMHRFVIRITPAACATAPRCSKSTTSLQGFSATEPASDQGAPQKCSLPENDAGYAPNPNRAVESS